MSLSFFIGLSNKASPTLSSGYQSFIVACLIPKFKIIRFSLHQKNLQRSDVLAGHLIIGKAIRVKIIFI